MTRVEQARVLIRVARNLLLVEADQNNDLDEPDLHTLLSAKVGLETTDGELFPFAPDMGEPLEVEGSDISPLQLGG